VSADDPAAAQRQGLIALDADGGREGASVPKVATGIPGFDQVAMGGLPARRATVVAGQAGSATTVFAAQFLAEGVRRGAPGVFVTLEEPAPDLRANLRILGVDVAGWESSGDWRFVDAPPLSDEGGRAPYSLATSSSGPDRVGWSSTACRRWSGSARRPPTAGSSSA